MYTPAVQEYNHAYYLAHHEDLLKRAREYYYLKKEERRLARLANPARNPPGRPRKQFDDQVINPKPDSKPKGRPRKKYEIKVPVETKEEATQVDSTEGFHSQSTG